MEVFSITCTTCKSRLKVRDPAVIGQILACPKCGGMVLVKPPEQPLNSAAEPAAITAAVDVATLREASRVTSPREAALRETIGDSTFGDIDELLSDAPPKPKIPAAALNTPVAAPPAVITAPLKLERRPPEVAHASAEIMEEPVEPPPLDWVAARPWRYWALLAGSLVAGVVLAVAVVVISIQLFQEDAAATVVVPPAQPPEASSQTAKSPAETSPPAKLPSENSVVKNPVVSVTPAPLEPPPVVIPTPPEVVAVKPATDPLGLTDPTLPATETAPDAVAKADPLGKFGALVEGGSDNPLPANEVPAEPMTVPSPGSEAATDEKPERIALPRPLAREIKLAARLADPLPAIDLDGVPLADFLQLMSDLSTIPMTLEPDSLWFIKSSASTPVTLHAANTTVGAALANALKPLGLEPNQIDNQIVVDLVRVNPPRSIKFPIHDLAEGDDQQAALLADWMMSLLAPDGWGDSPEAGKIVVDKQSLLITQQPALHAELFLFCEKLRVSRGLKPLTATKYDAALFRLGSRSSRAAASLGTPVTLNFSQPTLLVRILERLGAAGKVRILIDWHALAGAGWTTESEATLLTDKLSLADSLTRLLEPMDLAWRVVDDKTLQITTPAALSERQELEFYKADDLIAASGSGDKLLERIAAALGQENFHEGGGKGELRYDPAGKCVIAALPQPQQQALAKLLDEWRSAAQPAPAAAALNTLP